MAYDAYDCIKCFRIERMSHIAASGSKRTAQGPFQDGARPRQAAGAGEECGQAGAQSMLTRNVLFFGRKA